MKIIGFTGTRGGITEDQGAWLYTLIEACRMSGCTIGLHGDCVGADADFDRICRDVLGTYSTTCRPGDLERFRANTGAREVAPPEQTLNRNRKIVSDAWCIIACPGEMAEQRRSGTWSTIRAARKSGKPLCIIYPDGRLEKKNW